MSAIQEQIDYARKNYEEIKKPIKDYYNKHKCNDYQVKQLQNKLDKAKAEYVKVKDMTIEKRLAEQLKNSKGSVTVSTRGANMPLVKEIFHIMKSKGELTTWRQLKKFEPFTTDMLDKEFIDKEFNKEFDELEDELRYNVKKVNKKPSTNVKKVNKKPSTSGQIVSLNNSIDEATTKNNFAEIRASLKILKEEYDKDKYGATLNKKIEVLAEKFNTKYRSLFPN
jgi:uncharacterized protein YdiU (UPF0061 family)